MKKQKSDTVIKLTAGRKLFLIFGIFILLYIIGIGNGLLSAGCGDGYDADWRRYRRADLEDAEIPWAPERKRLSKAHIIKSTSGKGRSENESSSCHPGCGESVRRRAAGIREGGYDFAASHCGGVFRLSGSDAPLSQKADQAYRNNDPLNGSPRQDPQHGKAHTDRHAHGHTAVHGLHRHGASGDVFHLVIQHLDRRLRLHNIVDHYSGLYHCADFVSVCPEDVCGYCL